MAAVTVGMGIYTVVEGKKAAEAAKAEADKARAEMEKQKDAFSKLDTSNPYLNMENTMEDLTVNQQQAEFQKQQQMQQQANVLAQNRQASGSSGIAALAQTLVNQGALAAQQSSASIGQQEAANQQAAATEAAKLQGLEREGDLKSRQMQSDKISGLMGIAAGQTQQAQAMQAAAAQQQQAGMSQIASGAGQAGGAIGSQGPDFGNMSTEQFEQWLTTQG